MDVKMKGSLQLAHNEIETAEPEDPTRTIFSQA